MRITLQSVIILSFTLFSCDLFQGQNETQSSDKRVASLDEYEYLDSHSSDYIYDQDKLHKFEIFIDSDDLEEINSDPALEKYVNAHLVFENKVVNISNFRNDAKSLGLGEVSVQEFGKNTDVLLRVQKQEGGNKEQVEALNKIKNFFKDEYTIRRTEFVGPVVGEELKEAGITAVLLSLFLILIYIWFRFEWQFSIAAIFALSHDVLTTIGLFSLLNLEFNLAIVAALLTTAGYSINDTVVVFDRVRENLRRYKSQQNIVIYNRSINETLSRTVITSLTTLLALFVIYFFGGAVLKDFALAMIWGVVIGTYSSIFIAVSSLTFFKIYKGSEDKDKSKSVLEHEL